MGRLQVQYSSLHEYSKMNSAGESPEISELDELKKNFRAVQEENSKLQAVIADVTEVNKRWQQYNNDRQMYVQKLLSTIQDQQEQMNKIFPFQTQKSVTGDEATRLKTEVAALRAQMAKMEKEHKEHSELLELQLKAHRDDWEAERSEKRRALQDKEAAESRVRELEKELRNLKLKLREERALRTGFCTHCCGTHACEKETRHYHTRQPSKTYTTSVHLPCSSGQLLARGTTLYFGEDVVIDGEDYKQNRSSRTGSLEDLKQLPSSDKDMKGASNDDLVRETKDYNIVETENISTDGILGKSIDFNISPENLEQKFTNFIVHQSPCCSTNNIAQETSVALSHLSTLDSNIKQSTGVTIGFNSNGLASVTSFSPHVIVKSSSAPVSSDNEHICEASIKPSTAHWFIKEPPNEKVSKLNLGLLTTKSEGSMPASPSAHKTSVPWKPKYFENGVETQTREDVICPGCSEVFPPELHLEFLDHFEKCQKKNKKCSGEVFADIKSRN